MIPQTYRVKLILNLYFSTKDMCFKIKQKIKGKNKMVLGLCGSHMEVDTLEKNRNERD